uniref:Uncharacterized protein n=1 Tax=Panagrolaimus sp. JU765 TaxID=591449 RepID=A0AC34QPN8_9BILA
MSSNLHGHDGENVTITERIDISSSNDAVLPSNSNNHVHEGNDDKIDQDSQNQDDNCDDKNVTLTDQEDGRVVYEENDDEAEYYQEDAYSHDSIDDDDESSLTLEEKLEILEKFQEQPENKNIPLKSLQDVYPDVESTTEEKLMENLHNKLEEKDVEIDIDFQ